jgi:hypothetical protein
VIGRFSAATTFWSRSKLKSEKRYLQPLSSPTLNHSKIPDPGEMNRSIGPCQIPLRDTHAKLPLYKQQIN